VDFAEFYQATSPRTLRYAYALTGDLAQAQDVVQEAYVRAWQRWRQLSGYDDAEAWLRLVVSRLAMDWWRHLRVRRTAALVPSAPVPPPSEDTVLVVAALKKLPDRQRHAIAMHYLLDVSVAEIAAELGVSEGTVKSWLSRGRENLAATLRENVSSAALPTASDVEADGRRRRRKAVVVAATAVGVAILALVVLVSGVLSRNRTAPPPTVTPTGSPIAFTPLQRVGAVALPVGAYSGGTLIQDGRAFAVLEGPKDVKVIAADLASGRAPWPALSVSRPTGDRFRVASISGALVISTGTKVIAVDTATGRVRWQRDSEAEPVLFPGVAVLARAEVVGGRITGEAIGIDLVTGEPRWRIPDPVFHVFGMVSSDDLAAADLSIGGPQSVYAGERMFIEDYSGITGTVGITEYDAAAGTPTGRRHETLPTNDGYFLAYNDDVYIRSAREVYRLHLADGTITRGYSGEGVIEMAPCGTANVCIVDAVVDGGRRVVAIHDDRIQWTVTLPEASSISPAGQSLRVAVGNTGGSVVLDERGREVLRLPGSGGLLRLDAGNMLAYLRASDGAQARVIGIATGTARQTPLGTIATDPTATPAADGTHLVVLANGELVVYRLQ
jgi:RNA polymerase sigma-70 factor (sigma-E family)